MSRVPLFALNNNYYQKNFNDEYQCFDQARIRFKSGNNQNETQWETKLWSCMDQAWIRFGSGPKQEQIGMRLHLEEWTGQLSSIRFGSGPDQAQVLYD